MTRKDRENRWSVARAALGPVAMMAIMAVLGAATCTKSDTPPPRTDGAAPPDAPKDGTGSSPGDLALTFDTAPNGEPDLIGGGGSGSVDTATTPPMTCASIRNCVTACKGDSACKQRCPTTAPATERSAFSAIEACSKQKCPDGDEPCRCEVECLAGGDCTEMVDVCRGFEDDVFCDVNCH